MDVIYLNGVVGVFLYRLRFIFLLFEGFVYFFIMVLFYVFRLELGVFFFFRYILGDVRVWDIRIWDYIVFFLESEYEEDEFGM